MSKPYMKPEKNNNALESGAWLERIRPELPEVQAPDGYYDVLPGIVMQRVKNHPAPDFSSPNLNKRLWIASAWSLSLAASLLLHFTFPFDPFQGKDLEYEIRNSPQWLAYLDIPVQESTDLQNIHDDFEPYLYITEEEFTHEE